MSWQVAASLEVLLSQLNGRAPARSKASDGSIGDQAHAGRASDHNPWLVIGGQSLVTARDFTHDPAGGLDCQLLAEALRGSRDARIKYVIWNRRIMSGAGGPDPWAWRAYHGSNGHTRHLHLSAVATARCQDRAPWALPWDVSGSRPVLKLGARGPAVERLQQLVGADVDGVFGPATEARVRDWQRAHRLVADGIVGPRTWAALLERAA